MSKDLQILQLTADGKSQRMIAKMLSVSRNTISSVQAASARSGKTLPELLQMDEQQLVKVLFPEKELIPVQVKPDFEWIHKSYSKTMSHFIPCGKNIVISAERPSDLHTCILSSASCIQTMSINTD